MCNPVMFLAASTTLSVAGQLSQGRAAQRAAEEEAAQLEYQGAVDQDNARAEADLIRRQGAAARGQTVATIASSGVVVGQGSAGDAERLVMQDTETDAATAILNGNRAARGAAFRAGQSRQAGRDARRASYVGAATTLMSAAASGMRASGSSFNLKGWDAAGFNGTNDRGAISTGNNLDWWGRNGRGGD